MASITTGNMDHCARPTRELIRRNLVILARTLPLRYRPWHGMAILWIVVFTLAAWTWGATADCLVDFGRELYVPWQLSEGKVLYRDVAYFNGPLSPYVNALLFLIWGASVKTLFLANALILTIVLSLLFHQLQKHFSLVASTVTCVTTAVIFGVAHLTQYGNYNFISPYSHEMTHGMLLSVLVFCLLNNEWDSGYKWAGIGVLWGLVFLGKPEFFVATSMMIGTAIALATLRGDVRAAVAARQILCLLAGGFAIVAATWIALGQLLGYSDAALNLLGSWRFVLTSKVASLHFYQYVSGFNSPWHNLQVCLRSCFAIGLSLFGLFALQRNLGGKGWANPFTAVCLLTSLWMSEYGFYVFLLHSKALYALCVVLCAGMVAYSLRNRQSSSGSQYVPLACWSVFAMVLLSKMMLRPFVSFYGFALALPVFVLAAAMAIDWLPRAFSGLRRGNRVRYAVIALLLFDAGSASLRTCRFTRAKTGTLAIGAESLQCKQPEAAVLASTSEYLSTNLRPTETLLVLPEGVILNVMTGRASPSPYINFMPPEMEMYGENNILHQFEECPSDYVALVGRNVKEYGKERFGEIGYGDKIMSWLECNYDCQAQFGCAPESTGDFGIRIMRRKSIVPVYVHEKEAFAGS